jgi:hypothetical protein
VTEISIPGDELDTASSNLQQVLQLFGDSTTSTENLEAALGASDTLVLGTAKNFESRWGTGRSQIKEDGQNLINAIKKINSTFTDTDNNLANNLSPNSGGSSS